MRLDARGRELFVLHQAAQGASRSHAVLLCPPFGQEAIRAHRFYRVLADRLAGNGFDVLRFDYFGTGDSGGDDEDFDLPGAVADTRFLCEWARQRLHPARVSLVGLRLGADIAMLASARSGGAVAELILIEPVVDGAAYVEQMRQVQRRELAQVFGSRWALDAALRERNQASPQDEEVLGFGLGATLQRQLREQLAPRAAWAGSCGHALVLARERAACAHWVEQARPAVLDLREADSDVDWATDSAANTSIVPVRWIEQVLRCLRGEPVHA
ncbi:alpha/beta hydrolase [Thiomonas sp.]|uniref:serine aminopeptidase domain-containing protein n=1 Tax=Thiomonas sp. TaxID=2047785 RepID=UPI0026311AB8|nr:alpha/beta hydrolase [Thiomonas sp.]